MENPNNSIMMRAFPLGTLCPPTAHARVWVAWIHLQPQQRSAPLALPDNIAGQIKSPTERPELKQAFSFLNSQ